MIYKFGEKCHSEMCPVYFIGPLLHLVSKKIQNFLTFKANVHNSQFSTFSCEKREEKKCFRYLNAYMDFKKINTNKRKNQNFYFTKGT